MHVAPVSTKLPYFSLLTAATLWGIFWYPLRLFEDAGIPALQVTLVAYSAAFIAGLMYRRRFRDWLRYASGSLLVIALASGWCNASFIVAVTEGTVVRVVLLFYLSPIWTLLLGTWILGERMSLHTWAIFVLAMVGAVIMLWKPEVGTPVPQGYADWLALSSGLSFALANVYIRKLQDVPLPFKTVVSWAGGVLVAGAWILLAGAEPAGGSTLAWISCIALGLFGITVMTVCVQYGVTHMPVYRSAIILLFEIVIAAASAYLLAGETVKIQEWIGGLLVAVSTLLLAWEKKPQ